VHGNVRFLQRKGGSYALAAVVVLLLSALYTPLVRSSIMILVCHPLFQCVFGQCWVDVQPLFAIAAYLCIVTLSFFGVGVPVFMTLVLWSRGWLLRHTFREKEYGSQYMEDDGTEENPAQHDISMQQWIRFLVSDESVLSLLYDQLTPEWIFFLPMMLLLKLVLVIPPIFFEPDSWNQMTGVVCAELLFAVFVCSTTPYMSPWVDLLMRIGSAHQLMILGIQAFNSIALAQNRDSTNLENAMTATTAIYVLCCIGVFVALSVYPNVKGALLEKKQRETLLKFGLCATGLSGLYLLPTPNAVTLVNDMPAVNKITVTPKGKDDETRRFTFVGPSVIGDDDV